MGKGQGKKKTGKNVTLKDYQRIMVDPMFMIVKNLGLFITAGTKTAVAPTQLRLSCKNNFSLVFYYERFYLHILSLQIFVKPF